MVQEMYALTPFRQFIATSVSFYTKVVILYGKTISNILSNV